MSVPAQKILRIEFTALNLKTTLTDVKAQVYFNGVPKFVGGSALVLTEVDATNAPGLYELVLTAAQLTAMGVAAGQSNTIVAYINSASYPSAAPFRYEATITNLDDLASLIGTPSTGSLAGDVAAVQTKLGTPAGASVSVDIANVKVDTAAIRADLETGSSSLQTILTNIQQLQNASIGNGVGFVLPTMLIPATGTTSVRVPITIQDNNGALIDPTSNVITVGVLNAGGTDRSSYLPGASGSPGTVAATRSSVGQYFVMVSIPTSAIEEELIFSFSYQIGTNSMVRFGVSQVIVDGGAAGYALQSSLLATQTTVNSINSAVSNATYGLAALQGLLSNGTSGLAAIQALLANSTFGLSALQALLSNNGYGLSALATLLNTANTAIAAVAAAQTAMMGSGFVGTTDSLHALSTAIAKIPLSPGRAV